MPGFKQAFVQGLTELSTFAKEEPGTIRTEGGRGYRYVQLLNVTGGVAVAVGGAVSWFATGGVITGPPNGRVTSHLTDMGALPVLAGLSLVAITAAESLSGVFFWVQSKGPGIAAVTASGTIGQAMKASAATSGSLAVAAAATDPIGAVTCGVAGSNVPVILNCP